MIRICLIIISIATLSLISHPSQLKASMNDGNAALTRGDFSKAYRYFLAESKKGNAKAQLYLGWMYYYGKGINQDYRKSFDWYKAAANAGKVEALNALGMMYEKGLGVKLDGKEATKWYKKGAEEGDLVTQYHLATIYREGKIVGGANGTGQAVNTRIVLYPRQRIRPAGSTADVLSQNRGR